MIELILALILVGLVLFFPLITGLTIALITDNVFYLLVGLLTNIIYIALLIVFIERNK